MIKDFFNPPSLVLKARAPIMPKAMLAGPSNDAALQLLLLCLWMLFFMYRFTESFDTFYTTDTYFSTITATF